MKNRLVNVFDYREKKKTKIKQLLKTIELGVYRDMLQTYMRHPIFLNKRLILVPFEKHLIIWAWTKMKEIATVEMFDLGLEMFLSFVNSHPEYDLFVNIHPARIDSIRHVGDAIFVMIEMMFENFYDEDYLDSLHDCLYHIHYPLKISYKDFNKFSTVFIDFMKNHLKNDWENDFTESWQIFLLNIWSCIASGTIATPPVKSLYKTMGKDKYNAAMNNYFKESYDKLGFADEILVPDDSEIIQETFTKINDFYVTKNTNICQILIKKMVDGGNFMEHFPPANYDAIRLKDHGSKTNDMTQKFITVLSKPDMLRKLAKDMFRLHHNLHIHVEQFKLFDVYLDEVLHVQTLNIEEKDINSVKRLFLFIFKTFVNKKLLGK